MDVKYLSDTQRLTATLKMIGQASNEHLAFVSGMSGGKSLLFRDFVLYLYFSKFFLSNLASLSMLSFHFKIWQGLKNGAPGQTWTGTSRRRLEEVMKLGLLQCVVDICTYLKAIGPNEPHKYKA